MSTNAIHLTKYGIHQSIFIAVTALAASHAVLRKSCYGSNADPCSAFANTSLLMGCCNIRRRGARSFAQQARLRGVGNTLYSVYARGIAPLVGFSLPWKQKLAKRVCQPLKVLRIADGGGLRTACAQR